MIVTSRHQAPRQGSAAKLEAPFGTYAPTPLQRAFIASLRDSWRGHGRLRAFNAAIVDLLRPGPLDVTFRGAAFRVHAKGNITERNILLNPAYDMHELDFLIASTPTQDGVFVDVGANIGLYSLVIAAHLGAAGRIIAVEPSPLARERLAINRAISEALNVSIVPVAAGDSVSTVPFAHHRQNMGESKIDISGDIHVPMQPLTRILAQEGVAQIDSMKIDVEGYEDRALLPYLNEAPRSAWPRAVVIERNVEQWKEDCILAMTERGYRVVRETKCNSLLELPDTDTVGQRAG